MTEDAAAESCRNCGIEFPADELDANGWCASCRQVVVRRATLVARIAGAVVAVIIAVRIFFYVVPSERFFVFWLALIALAYYLVYKITRRVAFEVIRGRGVPPAED